MFNYFILSLMIILFAHILRIYHWAQNNRNKLNEGLDLSQLFIKEASFII